MSTDTLIAAAENLYNRFELGDRSTRERLLNAADALAARAIAEGRETTPVERELCDDIVAALSREPNVKQIRDSRKVTREYPPVRCLGLAGLTNGPGSRCSACKSPTGWQITRRHVMALPLATCPSGVPSLQ